MAVDLEYPSSLHKLHNDYPLAAEKIRVNKEVLSPYCEMIRHKCWASIGVYSNSGQTGKVSIALQKLAVTMVETVY